MGQGVRAILAITASAFGLATLSVVLSTRANTAGVITSAGNALSSLIGAATAPVTSSGGAIGGAAGGGLPMLDTNQLFSLATANQGFASPAEFLGAGGYSSFLGG